jgi:hypothetical protein
MLRSRPMTALRSGGSIADLPLTPSVRRAAILVVLVLLLCGTLPVVSRAAGVDRASSSLVRFRVVGRTNGGVVLQRRSTRITVPSWERVARIDGVPRFLVVNKGRTSFVLRRLPAPASDPVASINRAKAGAVVVVGPGSYQGRVIVPEGVSVIGFRSSSSWLRGPVLFRSRDYIAALKIGDAGETAIQNLPGAVGSTISDCRFRGGRAHARYDTVILGNGSASCSDIVFTHCQVERNLGLGNNIFIGDNGSVATGGAHVQNVTFRRCHIGVSNGEGGHDTGSPRAGLEAYTYPTPESNIAYHGWSNLRIIGCVFEATDGFCLALCDAPLVHDLTSRSGGPALVSGCTLKGGGYPSATNGCGTAGYTLEIESPKNLVIQNNRIYRGDSNAIQTGASNGLPRGVVLRGNLVDLDFDNGIDLGDGRYQILLGGWDHLFTDNTVVDHVSRYDGPYGVVTLDHAHGCVMTRNQFRIGERRPFLEINGSSGNTLSRNSVQ